MHTFSLLSRRSAAAASAHPCSSRVLNLRHHPSSLPVKAPLLRRCLANKAVPPVNELPKKINRTGSSLKRTASASLPIRANPTPTRGEIRDVFAFTTAERYDLDRLQGRLSKSAVKYGDSIWVPVTVPGQDGQQTAEAWLFRNGSMVCWGLERSEADSLVTQTLRAIGDAAIDPYDTADTEELEFVFDPSETTRLQGDLIILGKTVALSEPKDLPTLQLPDVEQFGETAPARYAFSDALARSTALGAFETALDKFMTSVERVPYTLSQTGEPGLKRKEIIQQLGQLLKFRQRLNLSRENFGDIPDVYWQEPELEERFKEISSALDISSRIEALNRKITYSSEVQVTLRELLTESSTHRMELIIIALIAVEVCLAMIREGPELWDMLRGHPRTGDQDAIADARS